MGSLCSIPHISIIINSKDCTPLTDIPKDDLMDISLNVSDHDKQFITVREPPRD